MSTAPSTTYRRQEFTGTPMVSGGIYAIQKKNKNEETLQPQEKINGEVPKSDDPINTQQQVPEPTFPPKILELFRKNQKLILYEVAGDKVKKMFKKNDIIQYELLDYTELLNELTSYDDKNQKGIQQEQLIDITDIVTYMKSRYDKKK